MSGKVGSDELPVNQFPESRQVIRANITIVDVVGVFPDVAGHQCSLIGGQWRCGIAGIDNGDGTISILDQPGPARAEVVHGVVSELLLESFKRTECRVDGARQFASWLTATVRTQAVPVECMVPGLGGIIENSAAERS